jgi:PAS domain S-box-containing protein
MNATPKPAEFPAEPVFSASGPESMLGARLAAAEARLADAEEILADAMLSSSSWIWESDACHRFIRIMGPIESIFGTKPEKLIGKKIEHFLRADDDPSAQHHLNSILQQKAYRDAITSINTPNGVRFVKASGKPLYDPSGKFLGYRGIGSDVTEQVQTERRASEANRRFMEAIENVPSSLMLCDREDRIVFCNSATQRYFPTASHLLIPGTPYEELLRAHAASGFVAEIGRDFEGWIRERMRQHRSGNTNIVRSYSDGRWSQIIERRASDGGIIGIRTDITELKRRENELQELAAKYRRAQEHLVRAQRIACTGSDERNFITDDCEWSDTTYEIFGVDRKSFVPSYENFLALVHPGDRDICLAMRQDLLAGKAIQPYEYRIIRPDGQMRTIYRDTVVNRDENGKPVSYTGTIRDVTELRTAEEAIRQKTREIENHAAELQRSNAELEQFAYVASHDLQEPLRMVASYCQMLQRRYKDKLDADANDFIGFAVEGANRMQRLINDLLSYSRTGRAGGSAGNPENFRAVDALKAALANLQGAISESGAKIEFGDLPMIRADRAQIARLFQNLLGNAIKFRRDGVSPLIRIDASAEGSFWRFTVEDNGIGIEKDYLDRVFLIFQRLHERHKYPGTGIGLAIAKKVIEHHGGRIWIESTPGQGSKFNFTLPAIAKTENA